MKRLTVDEDVPALLAEAVRVAGTYERLSAKAALRAAEALQDSDVLRLALRGFISERHEGIAALADDLSRDA